MLDSVIPTRQADDAARTGLILYLTVALRGRDPSALTALYALEHHLGYGAALRGLRRLQLWRFELDGSEADEALSRVGAWVTRSQLFVNPNQHTHELVVESRSTGARAAPHQPWIVAANEPDLEGEAATRLVRERLGDRTLQRAQKAVVWQLELDPTLPGERWLEIAEEIAIARGRRSGLLTNPHCQTVRVLSRASASLAGASLWNDA